MNQSFGFPQPNLPASCVDREIIKLLCQISQFASLAQDSEIALLCDASNGNAPVIVRYIFQEQFSTPSQLVTDAWNLDGTKYTGEYSTLVSCDCACAGGEGGSGSILAEYFICDNGTQKIVQLCGTNCSGLAVNYYLLDRTTSTAPSDWTKVILGECLLSRGRQHTKITSSTSETTIVTADATHHLDIYSILLTNTSSSDCAVTIREATAGAVAWVFEIPTHETRGFTVSIDSASPQSSVNNNWTAQCGTSVDSIDITALYTLRA